ncbi:MAG: hypothetical protein JOZ62_03845 [Acidobacteriaceae bacterium]|nr:hypothetical protein [Acidobacteriaceae bacterium]
MKQLALRFWIAITLALPTTVVAQTVIVGTGNPDVDVPAVQAAVDQGGEVILRGQFSFDRPPTIPTAIPELPLATVLVSKAVAISGTRDVSIEAGTVPFYIEAPGASVSMQKLRFVRPTRSAILVYAVSGLTIASCRIEGVVTVPNRASTGVSIATEYAIPTPDHPGNPENISGRLVIANNDIDMTGGTSSDNVIGLLIFSIGISPDREVDVYVSGNNIRNVTEPAINIRRVGGRAHVESNVLITAPVSSTTALRPEVIRAVNIGSYVIAHNSIECQWPDPDAVGIGVWTQVPDWPMEHAVVVDNQVTMSPPEATVFGSFSAGIGIWGFAADSYVANNRIRGRARAALAVDVFNGGIPANNAFVQNRFEDFEPSVADVFIDTGVPDTLILGQRGTVRDQGVNTVVLPFRGR